MFFCLNKLFRSTVGIGKSQLLIVRSGSEVDDNEVNTKPLRTTQFLGM